MRCATRGNHRVALLLLESGADATRLNNVRYFSFQMNHKDLKKNSDIML